MFCNLLPSFSHTIDPGFLRRRRFIKYPNKNGIITQGLNPYMQIKATLSDSFRRQGFMSHYDGFSSIETNKPGQAVGVFKPVL